MKKQISVHKFVRVAKNKKSTRVRGLYCSASFSLSKNPAGLSQAIEAYVLDGFIYMWLKCKKQQGNRIKTYFTRYKLESEKAMQDWVIPGNKV